MRDIRFIQTASPSEFEALIFELRPDIDWDKGKALSWLLEKLDLDRRDVVPLYLGDNLTDEERMIEGGQTLSWELAQC